MEAGYQMYIDHVPDADLQMLLEVNKKGFDLFNELPVGDRLDLSLIHIYRGETLVRTNSRSCCNLPILSFPLILTTISCTIFKITKNNPKPIIFSLCFFVVP